MVGSLDSFLIVCHALRLLCSVFLTLLLLILSTNVFPVSMVVSPKGSIEYCFLYVSYMLFDSSVRPGT